MMVHTRLPSTVYRLVQNISSRYCTRSQQHPTSGEREYRLTLVSFSFAFVQYRPNWSPSRRLLPLQAIMALPPSLWLLIAALTFLPRLAFAETCASIPPQHPCTLTFDPSRVAQTGQTTTLYQAIVTTQLNVRDASVDSNVPNYIADCRLPLLYHHQLGE